MIINRIIYSSLVFLFLLFVYVFFPVPVYWTQYADYFRIFLFLYTIVSSLFFYFLIKDSLDKKIFHPLNIIPWFIETVKKRKIFLALILIASVKIFTIYTNPLWLISDESFHIHRGQAFLIHVGEKTGILSDTLGVETYQLENSFNRYPPMGMVIQGLSFAFFGGINTFPYLISNGLDCLQNHFILDEMAARAPSLIFVLLTFIVLFKLTNLYYDERTAFFSSIITMFLPAYFMFTSSAHLTSGVVFFSVFIVYLLMRFVKTEDFAYIILCALIVAVGVLYKRPLMFFVVLIPLYLSFFVKIKNRTRVILTYLLIVAMITIPYYVMFQILADYRPFSFIIPNVTKLSAFLITLPLQMTLPLAVVSIIAVFAVGNKNPLSRFCVLWFILWYILFSFDMYVFDRLTIPLLVPIAILSADFILSVPIMIRTRLNEQLIKIIIIITMSFLLMESLVVFYGTDDIRSQYEIHLLDIPISLVGGYGIKNNGFPYHETVNYINRLNESDDVAIFSLENRAFFDLAPILEFYLRNSDGNQKRKVYEFTPLNATNDISLRSHLKDLDVDYVVIPKIDYNRFRDLLYDTYTETDLDNLDRMTKLISSSGHFVAEEEFYFGTNGFLIFKLIN